MPKTMRHDFQSHRLAEYTGQHGVTTLPLRIGWGEGSRVRCSSDFPGDAAAATKACSDHRPIWIRVRVPASDDD
jgi:hypothetical protein